MGGRLPFTAVLRPARARGARGGGVRAGDPAARAPVRLATRSFRVTLTGTDYRLRHTCTSVPKFFGFCLRRETLKYGVLIR